MARRQGVSDNPIIVSVGLIAGLIAIVAFVTGRHSLPELLDQNRADPALPRFTADGSRTHQTAADQHESGDAQASWPLAMPTDEPRLEIEIEATSDAWLQVQIDSLDALKSYLREGESSRWTAREAVRVRTSNAGGIRILLNGQPLSSL